MTQRVLLVDDHELIRQGLARAFERAGEWEVVGEAAGVAEALALARVLKPDVVVTDLQMPDGSGFDVVRALREDSPEVGLVILTMHLGDAQVLAAMEAGASAFLGKETRGPDVVAIAAQALRDPDGFVSTGLAGAIRRRAAVGVSRLTDRETEVMRCLADGLGTAEIAARLYLGESTVKTHLNRIYRKLGVRNRTQALAEAVRAGLLLDQVAP
ncbi:response regulator transcription factor [Nocardioides bruguierae]|uniref:Response regulator transcription factor n=1 Tax=Nocardioides bruguierae TaxID=2945102 RepID=A0A9X2IDN8_9ACTN|nr:response regulator transcription factor [Nocardioides bruguierae]MCM0619223.1 response regulator transcription factor [Nocardioides bruguierae]